MSLLLYSFSKLFQSTNVIKSYLKDALSKDVQLSTSETNANFNHNTYFKTLDTKRMGHVVLFSHVVTSTMNTITRYILLKFIEKEFSLYLHLLIVYQIQWTIALL
jgi:hypothetical protein